MFQVKVNKMNSNVTAEAILEHLKTVTDPLQNCDIVTAQRIDGILIKTEKIYISLTIPLNSEKTFTPIQGHITKLLESLYPHTPYISLTTHQKKGSTHHHPLFRGKLYFPHIQFMIAVASGKGGVGKSTTSVNLAFALKYLGLNVGLLDADVYGPSLPHLLGIKDQPLLNESKELIPEQAFGLPCMSMGLLLPPTQPVIWRGPMIQNAVLKFFNQVSWGHLDILIIDLPPGTGDTHLTIVQKAPLNGVVIVSTPQDLALIDAQKAISMFQTVEIPILGMIENMSYFECPACHHQTPIFHQGGAQEKAKAHSIPYLGDLPLDLDLRQASDKGIPLTVKDILHPISQRYISFAKTLWEQLKATGNP